MQYTLKTKDTESIRTFLSSVHLPAAESHKGDNGKALIIGGSTLFHASVLWSAEVAAHFVDMLHFASTKENNRIVTALKKIFRNGIVVEQKEIPAYIEEDEAILIGPGMVRTAFDRQSIEDLPFEQISQLEDEAMITAHMTKYLLTYFPKKRFVLDAGALQMMDPSWLLGLEEKAILTPHQIEFRTLFGVAVKSLSLKDKVTQVEDLAKKYRAIIVLKAVKDIISDGETTYIVEGGNQGLTKGGSGDVLSGLITALRTKNEPLLSAVAGSVLLKRTADDLKETKGYWYTMSNLIDKIPESLQQLRSIEESSLL